MLQVTDLYLKLCTHSYLVRFFFFQNYEVLSKTFGVTLTNAGTELKVQCTTPPPLPPQSTKFGKK
jgi:hypothetical protein